MSFPVLVRLCATGSAMTAMWETPSRPGATLKLSPTLLSDGKGAPPKITSAPSVRG
jgi:hypothetical protein